MKSMTGYGKGEAVSDSRKVTIELKSVNNRYLDIAMRLPRTLAYVEDAVKKQIQAKISRGTVDVFFTYELSGEGNKTVTVDESLLKGYVAASDVISRELGQENDLTVAELVKVPELLVVSAAPDDTEAVTALFVEATGKAVAALNAMRETEGANAKDNLLSLVGNIRDALGAVIGKAPLVVSDYKEKLTKRINELLDGIPVDESRIAMEVAMFADKCDINEEISRLSSHISQFITTLDLGEPIGRKLDFLSQEMNREINTMGSKANDLELTQNVIYMKNELEKIKEQIRNVE